MNHLWLFWLPLIFLPNLGAETPTALGTLTLADYLIGPYLVFLFIGLHRSREERLVPAPRIYVRYLIPTMLWFLWWAFISTLSIYFRFNYADQSQIIFGLLKLAKLALYVTAAVLTILALARLRPTDRQKFDWAMTVIGLMTGLTLLLSGNQTTTIFATADIRSSQVFQENPISVLMAILIAYLAGKVIDKQGSTRWRSATAATLGIMFFGLVFAEGRGGWVAAAVGVAYIGFRRINWRTFRWFVAGVVLLAIAYSHIPSFRDLVDRTLNPDQTFLAQYNAGVFGLDDGARLIILQIEAPKILNDPFLGRGFFHRGGLSGIFTTGSHNFFLQMFLETGFVGGSLILVLLFQMWRHASQQETTENGLALPTKAALVAAIVAGLSGEYFYGGTVLLILLLAYAPVGAQSLPLSAMDIVKPLPPVSLSGQSLTATRSADGS